MNANPYAFLDDAPLEERRARAVALRRTLPGEMAEGVGSLDSAAIDEVVRESWPVVRDADDLHDALLTLVWVPAPEVRGWQQYLPELVQSGRATEWAIDDEEPMTVVQLDHKTIGWVATEQLANVQRALAGDDDATVDAIVHGWMESIGPVTTEELARRLWLQTDRVKASMIRLESQGHVLRGRFRPRSGDDGGLPEWCHRRLLARIHRLTIGTLRKQVEPVATADFMRFLFQWQHVTSGSRQHGEPGLLEVIRQLSGFEAAASSWDSQLLRTRMAKYEPHLLDRLCLSGAVSWGRLSPHPRLMDTSDRERLRRITPTSVAPISLFPVRTVHGCWTCFRPVSGMVPIRLLP